MTIKFQQFEEHIDSKDLNDFLRSEKRKVSSTKRTALIDLENDIYGDNDNLSDIEKKELEYKFRRLILKNVQYTINREILISSINIKNKSVLFNRYNGEDELLIDNNEIFDYEKISTKYRQLYRNVNINSDNKIVNIKFIFGKKYKVNELDLEGYEITEKFDYIYINVDVENEILTMSIAEKSNNMLKENHSSNSLFERFIVNNISDKYEFSIEENNELHTLYKMFNELTKEEENIYRKRTLESENLINNFINEVNIKYNFKDYNEINEWTLRVNNLVTRRLIRQDFDSFLNRAFSVGKVLKIRFVDVLGGTVDAKSGGTFGNKELDLQDSDVYFDTKDSIHIEKALKSITIRWDIPDEILPKDDRTKYLNVRYTAYKRYYITHFIKMNVREEVAEYVLPKFEWYRKIPE
ncbi:hypothetical protein G7084_03845 [Weissella coleopterorum]|uniref:Uncharacterized protein n=1 Tax=Weissella coleopterorum TaxID=2714949 RepID=A0A6G8AZJ9_9LACO|nr:hypothetical protein [Weissella coleopterorum]QIL50521.1 hypothetical protein G7084_03845 [Weissella coleopterorum]